MHVAKLLRFVPKFQNFRGVASSPVQVDISPNSENLQVKTDVVVEEFPLVWLRDNCSCASCYHKESKSRTINWNHFDVDVSALSVEVLPDNKISVQWNDNHKSVYEYDWLKSRSFTRRTRQNYLTNIYQPRRKLWDKHEFFDIMHVYDYKDVISNKRQLYNWLKDLSVYGVVLMENAPTDDELLAPKFANDLVFIRKTHYGEHYQIKAKEGGRNAAYLTGLLQLHTDLPYYDYKPGVIMLHCIEQTKAKGGENLLGDAFFVAEKLRNENKEVFDILSNTDVNWFDIGTENNYKFHKILRSPVIELDRDGNVKFITQSIHLRDSHFTVDIDQVKPWYRAMQTFVNAISDHAAEFKTKPGQILTFDNTRLVHGRLGYEDTKDNSRLLVGFYLDWDELYSKLRVLQAELNL